MFLSWHIRADSRFRPSQWEMSLQSNAVSHWQGGNVKSACIICVLAAIKVNSLTPGRFWLNFRLIFKLILVNGGWDISYQIALRWIALDLTDDKSTLVRVMARSHYLSQYWPRFMSPNDVTRPQWVISLAPGDAIWCHGTCSTVPEGTSHYLNQCWHIMDWVLTDTFNQGNFESLRGNFMRSAQHIRSEISLTALHLQNYSLIPQGSMS